MARGTPGPDGGRRGIPTVTSMPDWERSSRAGLATMPAPSSRTLEKSTHRESRSGLRGGAGWDGTAAYLLGAIVNL